MAFLDGLRALFGQEKDAPASTPAINYSAPISRGVKSPYYFAPTRPSTRRELSVIGYGDISRSSVVEKTNATAPATGDFVSRVLAAFGTPSLSGPSKTDGGAFVFGPIAPPRGAPDSDVPGVSGGQQAPGVEATFNAAQTYIQQVIAAVTTSSPSGSVAAPPAYAPADVYAPVPTYYGPDTMLLPYNGSIGDFGDGQSRGGGRGAVPG